ncbi:cytochrome c biogenesis CcdA family protein [Thermosediminibacter oceani]|uniref:Cytochrome c biogenesis protein transmembrane region n=1 Tax=Thermosediminibacter oceani (strain ATCC BAA-1034 / DSM 16646 / JW/IW-1228P) TaxID=555079 RepID=D9S1X4_THEOJ|nr:cytochrome c biogenesis CcdA family protein [Thermosediminibacter oceani]ADL07401.1 cytochrome c biogenesis protein transmembrane region [Thermosediminibacter oceani DSM 16646]
MAQISNLSIGTAFLAGILTFFSPCTLPLLPAYLSVLAGGGISKFEKRAVLITNSICFITGFSLIFTSLGLSVTALGQFLLVNRIILSRIAGIFVIIFGLFLVSALKIPFFMRERRGHPHFRRVTPLSAFIMGCAFSLGWTPCLGPVLSSVLLMAGSTQDFKAGAVLLLIFSAGLALPFFYWPWPPKGSTPSHPGSTRTSPSFRKPREPSLY